MSYSISAQIEQRAQRQDPVFFWLIFIVVAFFLFPSYGLDYGLFESTSDELIESYGWNSIGIAQLWFILPLLLLFRPIKPDNKSELRRHYFDAGYSLFCMFFTVATAWIFYHSMGYATIFLFIGLGMIMTHALARLEWMGGDKFVIGALITIIILILTFILYPTIAIFLPMFMVDGHFVPFQFVEILTKPYIVRVILNSVSLGIAVSFGATFFGLICALYTARIAKKSVIVGRIFSLLPIVTPPFVVGLGVTLMMGRSGYVTEFFANHLGVTVQKNWRHS